MLMHYNAPAIDSSALVMFVLSQARQRLYVFAATIRVTSVGPFNLN